MIHPTAAGGFSLEADRYERARPGYPGDAVAVVVRLARGRVLDLAAGTGKLTIPLVDRGLDVVAVEPLARMRHALAGRAVPVVGAVAEWLPFAAATFSVVTVAQAFHWFDAERASAEIARVVAPGGHLVVVTNERLREEDWERRVWEIMDAAERDAPWKGSDRRRGGRPAPPWEQIEHLTFPHRQPATVDLVVDRLASTSHIALLPPAEKERTLARIRDIAAAEQGPLAFHYRTHVVVWRR